MAGNESEAGKKPEIKRGEATPHRQVGWNPPEADLKMQSDAPGPDRAADRPEEVYPCGSPTAMLIRIFGKRDQEPYGDIVHYDLKKPVPYQSAAELVLRIHAISRSLDIPDPGSGFRSIRESRDESANMLPEEYWKKESGERKFQKREGSLLAEPVIWGFPAQETGMGAGPQRVRDTIYLQLIGRQHTSIQGRIWGRATRKKYISFRSALELIYLLSETV